MCLLFETDRLMVRHFTAEDSEGFFLLNSDPEVMRYIRPVKTREECNAFLDEIIVQTRLSPGVGRWAVTEKASGEFAGSFAVIPVEHTACMQMGYAFLPKYWGKGFASEAAIAGVHYIFSKTDLPLVYGYTEIPNIASQKVLLKAGFVPNGTKTGGEKDLAEFIYRRENYPGAVAGKLQKEDEG
jgi:[ribosomal protein S5]-alanine N-acetyltransferase